MAVSAWRAVGGRDAGRIDLRCDESGRPQIMEINPLAGLHPTHSDLPMLWTALGHRYAELIERIVDSAQRRIESEPGGPRPRHESVATRLGSTTTRRAEPRNVAR
jgi:D-alanine-D-alanine ligase